MIAYGFSWPSTTCVCRDVYTSLKLIGVGAAPIERNRSTQRAPAGVRMRKLARSSARWIGWVLLVICRIPFSHILGCT